MTVAELIAELQKLPPQASVRYIWDGEPRSSADLVWLARSGHVNICTKCGTVYDKKERPVGSEAFDEDPYWYPDPKATPW